MFDPPVIEGAIYDVKDGVVYGHLIIEEEEFEFSILMEDILECQRSYIQPGAYVSFPNGYLLVYKTIWTTHDIEEAKYQALRWIREFGWWDEGIPP